MNDSFGQKWYARLVEKEEEGRARPLLRDFPLETISRKLVVCLNTKDGKKLFSVFESPATFNNYQLLYDPEYRSFYELIFGEFPQKPHFDIDIDSTPEGVSLDDHAQEILDNLFEAISGVMETCQSHFNLATDIRVYTSHGSSKRSFHVILPNHCCGGNVGTKAFYQLVAERMEPEFIKSGKVDHKVYSPRQQFRILGSQKCGSNRPKILAPSFKYKNVVFTQTALDPLFELETSLVGFTYGCTSIAVEPPPDKRKVYASAPDIDLSPDCVRMAMQELATWGGVDLGDSRFPYQVNGVVGSLITLKRLIPSECQICKRIHEHENPFLVVKDDGKIGFYCRRSPNDGILVGSINVPLSEELSPDQHEVVKELEGGGAFVKSKTESSPDDSSQLTPPIFVTPMASSTLLPTSAPKEEKKTIFSELLVRASTPIKSTRQPKVTQDASNKDTMEALFPNGY